MGFDSNSDGVIDVIKRGGTRPTESFSPSKLHSSIVAACLSEQTPVGQAEAIAETVTANVIDWLQSRPEVTSHDLRRITGKHLQIHHPTAAYLYEQHRITI